MGKVDLKHPWNRLPHSRLAGELEPFADRAFARATDAALVLGNSVQILRDARENYPAWLDAIVGAERSVFFENYIISDDEVGRQFAMVLAERARAGIRVRLIYDWLGTWRASGLWRMLAEAGAEVRCFNPPRIGSPFGWLTRDHRKMIAVDGRVGFVSGLCLSKRWRGDPARKIDEWRDTGIVVRGPALAQLERAFVQVWEAAGARIDAKDLTPPETIQAAGDVAVRVIATVPSSGGLFRFDQLISAIARERLWLTDAYFVGLTPYVRALCAAARDGVDVRLLVPGASDLPLVSRLSRAGYRPLLEAGVRVFEWNGSMLHAKTAVADERWARVGTTNLNVASWLGNYEIDLAVENLDFAAQMAAMYEDDLNNATEIVLNRRRGVRETAAAGGHHRRALAGSAGRAAAGALSVGAAVGAALTNRRVLEPTEANLLATVAVVLIAVAVVGVLWPPALAFPAAVLAAWVGIVVLIRARRLWRKRPRKPDVSASR
jgi:cardiolipin synthase A/B